MVKSVKFVSRQDAMGHIFDGTFKRGVNLISISDTVREAEVLCKSFAEMRQDEDSIGLFLVMPDDIEYDYSREAEVIYGWANDDEVISDCHTVYVHCAAGLSRSGAIAKWLNEYFELGCQKLSSYTRHNIPLFNKLCYLSGVPNITNYYAAQSMSLH